jgi:hypothetical protein
MSCAHWGVLLHCAGDLETRAQWSHHSQGSNASDAASQAVAYIDVFRSLAIIGEIMIPIAFSLKSIDLNAPLNNSDGLRMAKSAPVRSQRRATTKLLFRRL